MKCPLCGGRVFKYDATRDEVYCVNCGYVLSTSEKMEFIAEMSQKTRRAVEPPGSVFNGSGRYRRLSRINNKNDLSTYRILVLQKVKNVVRNLRLPDVVYEWVARELKSHDWNWYSGLVAALLWIGAFKHGYYIEVYKIAEEFEVSVKSVRKWYRFLLNNGYDMVMATSSKILENRLRNGDESYCVRCCVRKMYSMLGDMAISKGLSPGLYIDSLFLLCKLYCDTEGRYTRLYIDNRHNISSYRTSVKRVFDKLGLDSTRLSVKNVKSEMERLLGGVCRDSGDESG